MNMEAYAIQENNPEVSMVCHEASIAARKVGGVFDRQWMAKK